MSAQGGAERVRPCGWTADFQSIGHLHRHFIRTANTFRRSLTFLSCARHPRVCCLADKNRAKHSNYLGVHTAVDLDWLTHDDLLGLGVIDELRGSDAVQ